MMDINNLFELNELARKDAAKYPKKRELYKSLISESGKHFIGIVGPRGVGKTVILKQIANKINESFYLSMDSVEEVDMFELAKILSDRYGYRLLLLDEIHYQKDFEKKLKKIFDFLNIKVIFSSSVSLSMLESSYDLSRRVKLVNLNPFTFREYIYFTKNVWLPDLTFDNILYKEWKPEHLRYEYLFDDYLTGGIFPFSLEEPQVFPLLKNILKKIVTKDIPTVTRLMVDEPSLVEKMIQFIGKSDVDGINYSSISSNIGITKYKAESYINLLKDSFVLNVVFPTGTNVLKEPKVLFRVPYRLLYRSFEEAKGGIREDFVAEVLQIKGLEYHYLKTTRGKKTPDFLVKQETGDIIVEIGGKGKGREQFKGIKIKRKIILSHSNIIEGIKRPLFLLGFI